VELAAASAGCTDGTTPVCDDAGSCLISSSVDGGNAGDAADAGVAETSSAHDGSPEASAPSDGGDAGGGSDASPDAPAE
jgi:hypothetical protein